ncbi:pyridoxal-phosphate dependent enzyme [Treponema ruminis]|uniref:Threonine synthase n=1 Tax=Treponema ruminis TaxID=744515 RepID=A0A7W8G8W4_9SPIR|nr:pyridoxal-phosphate dependent enzyme [Treponema ruminis]MBB5226029.1 threonine synthase [Treponema ruminis]QSI03062.1 pyridoxal-phosphate dependent enzyme [Treponema ruminis]
MKFTSTRNPSESVNFAKAVLDCMPEDGGLYIPEEFADLRKWILYTNENTSFSSIAGTLTSACINTEFSPIICETIATKAFPFSPKVQKIDENLFTLELYHTPSGSHKEFGVSYLVNCLETILTLQGGTATFLDATTGEIASSLARAIRGKKNLKAVLLFPKGFVRGLIKEDFVWNGGNVLPVEVDGDEKCCHELVREIFANRSLVEKYNLTVANTANIGRLMPQTFFYPYAFSQLKNQVTGGIFYAMPCGNYSNLVAGLYSWRLSLPVNGFICPTSDEIKVDLEGNCEIMDSIVDLKNRGNADPASPSNLERLEEIFTTSSLMLKHFVYPAQVSKEETEAACQKLFKDYGIYANKSTSRAYAAALKRNDIFGDEGSSVVLVMRDHPALDSEFIRHTLGKAPELPNENPDSLIPTELKHPCVSSSEEVMLIIADEL